MNNHFGLCFTDLELCRTGGPLSSVQAGLSSWLGSAASSSPEEARYTAGCALAYQAGAQGSSSRFCLRGCFPWVEAVGGNPDTQDKAPTTCTCLCWGGECFMFGHFPQPSTKTDEKQTDRSVALITNFWTSHMTWKFGKPDVVTTL